MQSTYSMRMIENNFKTQTRVKSGVFASLKFTAMHSFRSYQIRILHKLKNHKSYIINYVAYFKLPTITCNLNQVHY